MQMLPVSQSWPRRMRNRATAICITGSVRTLFETCTLSSTLERVAKPLNADLFAFVNLPLESSVVQLRDVERRINQTAQTASISAKMIEADNKSPNSRWPGVAQARGLLRCWQAAGKNQRYDILVRARTDTYHGFVFPLNAQMYVATNAVYAGFIGNTVCSRSVGHPKAPWVDDRFAVLVGKLAQRAYLLDFSNSLRALKWSSRRANSDILLAPECLMGRALSDRNDTQTLSLYDLRQMISKSGPRFPATCEAATQIIRRDCSSEIRSAHWLCSYHTPPILDLKVQSLREAHINSHRR